MKQLILLLFLCFSILELSAQNSLDSLLTIWNNKTVSDTIRSKAFTDYIYTSSFYTNPDSAIIQAAKLYKFTENANYKKGSVDALNLSGYTYFRIGKYANALEAYKKGLKLAEDIQYKKGAANILLRTGYIYHDNGDIFKALDYYQKSLKIFEKIEDNNGMSAIYNEYGNIYLSKMEYENSLKYYQKAITINNELNNQKGNASLFLNIAQVYLQQDNLTKSLDYFEKGLRLFENTNDKLGIASGLAGIADIYNAKDNINKALEYFQKSLKLSEEINDVQGMVGTMFGIAYIYIDKGEYTKAINICKKSLALTKDLGDINDQEESCYCLYEAFKAKGNTKEAVAYLEKVMVFKDSIKTEASSKKLQQMEFSKLVLQDSIATVERERLVSAAHEKEMQQEEKTRNILFGIAIIILILASGLYLRLRFVRKSKAILKIEKDRSENLLLNILPAEIAQELKDKGKADARDFDKASILFTDFKGFTQASEKLSAKELVAEINTCFKAFDIIITKYGIEKIKTIGDAYMAAGGLPVPTDDSVKKTVLAALEMQDFICKRKLELDSIGKTSFEMRVGIYTGPVVAGIVGVKKFQYDIWGNTVNTASRMESSGEVGKVNIGHDTYELLKNDPDFTFVKRGKIEAKGKGKIEMWFVKLKGNQL